MSVPHGLDPITSDIAVLAARVGLRLRFDRVVLRIFGDLRAALTDMAREGEVVIVTISAPIRLPGKTAADIAARLRGSAASGDFVGDIFGNQVQLRHVMGVPADAPSFIGLVHNRDSNAARLLDLAEARLLAAPAR